MVDSDSAAKLKEGQALPTLADRINYLFDRIRREDGSPYSNVDVAKTISAQSGRPTDRAHISALRSGDKVNPTRRVLQGLATHFRVPASFFFDDDKSTEIAEQIEVAVALRDPRTRDLALQLLRTTDPADVALVASIVRALGERPELREALELLLSLEAADARLAVRVLQTVRQERIEPSTAG
ncbi:XRE family transcriptional regulator [Amycolatopsis sp. NEAU-NG30]|uniref:XRE family transcriptional regulator n=1 Tax=Amycolatopsis melonis TaxID=3156488 RepID=A0ABV0LEL7_9PSEU